MQLQTEVKPKKRSVSRMLTNYRINWTFNGKSFSILTTGRSKKQVESDFPKWNYGKLISVKRITWRFNR